MTERLRLSHAQARLAFIAAQGLPSDGAPATEVLARTGFVRTLGGVEAYLALRARVPGLGRAGVESLVAAGAAQVVPAVRSCMYLVARRDVPLALRVADLLSYRTRRREFEKAEISSRELDDLGEAVLALLGDGPLSTDAIRKAVPVRSLGEAGKKVGLSSPLPPALRQLEFAGRIERFLDGGRLDSERYLWRAVDLDFSKLPEDRTALFARVGEIFLRAAGLSTTRTFAAWCGLSQSEAQAALTKLPLIQVEVEGAAEPGFLLESERARILDGAGAGAAEAVALLPFEDNLVALHGGPAALAEPRHWSTMLPSWGSGGRASTLGEARHISLRGVVAEGQLAGFWEYDPDARQLRIGCFAPLSPATRARLDGEADDVTQLLRDELGHGRSYSLDTDDELRKRAASVRTIGSR